jgi:protein-S-isoprenylcysteine O-methyltransferase Ste14
MAALKMFISSLIRPGFVAAVMPWLLLRSFGGSAPTWPSIWTIGLLPILLGIALYFWCTTIFISIGKRASVSSKPAAALIVEGFYRWVRNPMYIAILSILVGEAILFRSFVVAGYALLVWLYFHNAVVSGEERVLLRRYGASYEAYLATVPRWIPRSPHS